MILYENWLYVNSWGRDKKKLLQVVSERYLRTIFMYGRRGFYF